MSLPDTIAAARALLESGEMRCADLLETCLARIEKHDPTVRAFLSTFAQPTREAAHEHDTQRDLSYINPNSGDAFSNGPALAGIPIAIKDNLCTSFGKTTCSSRMLENFHAPYDATVVRKLQAAGALIIGKTNLDEFAMGSSCENSYFGSTRNPWDTDRVPGGSSGGSAAALAAGMCLGSIGSDTGGSIRLPASFCGLVGLKPTYGRVSRYGLVAFASSLDQVGPFAWTVEDAAILLNVIAGPDPMDSTCLPNDVPDYTAQLNTPIDGLRIGIVKQFREAAGIDPQVQAAFEQSLNVYRQHGATIVDVDLPNVQYGIAAYYIIAPCEASSNLARYDGVHFGHRTSDPVKDIAELFSKSRAEGFGPEVQRRILIGTYALSSGYYDAYYNNALKVRRLIKNDFDAAFAKCDVIATPTGPTPAFKLGEKTSDPMSMYLTDVFTVTCNIAGLPGLSLPCGFTTDAKPLPIGLQLLGPHFSEQKLLRAARMYESKTDWHKKRPTL